MPWYPVFPHHLPPKYEQQFFVAWTAGLGPLETHSVAATKEMAGRIAQKRVDSCMFAVG